MLNWLMLGLVKTAAAAAAKLLQSCPTLCDHIDSSLPDPSIGGILQARILEWVAISFSNGLEWVKLIQITIISTTVGKNLLEEME